MEWATGLPNYNTMMQCDTATIGRVLQGNGYIRAGLVKTILRQIWKLRLRVPYNI